LLNLQLPFFAGVSFYQWFVISSVLAVNKSYAIIT
jgi:hypothetical protein